MIEIFKYLKGDRALWVIAILFALMSMVTVFSFIPSLVEQQGGSYFGYLIKHMLILLTGFVIMYYIHRVDYKYFARLAPILFWTAVVLLVLTWLLGTSINGAKRWIQVPIVNQSFQTSDFAKLALLIYVGRMLVVKKDLLHSFKEGVWPILWPILLICALILPQDFSTAGMLFGICMILLFIGNMPMKFLGMIFGGIIVGLMLIFAVGKSVPGALPRLDTWVSRIESFWQDEDKVDKDAKQQRDIGYYAIANAKFWGTGPGKGEYKKKLFAASADMYTAAFIEEYGVPGVSLLIGLFLTLLFRSLRIAAKCQKNFGTYVCIGIGVALMFQALINMAVPTGLVPMTGQNMPLLGLGGTSIWFTCISLGIILSVSREVYPEREEEENNHVKSNDNLNEEKYVVT
jgi:cell division protein FtsW